MGPEHRLARAVLDEARRTFLDEVDGLSTDEALDAAGGYRSILGVMKHVAGWAEVYRSYALDPEPRHWEDTAWPRGLRDRIEPTGAYLNEIRSWFERTADAWLGAVDGGVDLEEARPVHGGGTASLGEIAATVAAHWTYHAGEINEILALRRGEAWEDGEEVEENHIDTTGHRVRPPWMDEPAPPG
ncbi:MAG TPA: DinB family protein [Actinomycetota bacterium]|nr:DinB family protein [Actinomycetota bacterium]